ncbi:MAG: hypothetical protein ACKVOU_12095, partial [Cytophagales bacterium]
LLQRNNMRLYIKHMVSLRCKMIVKQQLNKLGIKCSSLDLGSVEISEAITAYQHDHLQINLQKLGLLTLFFRIDTKLTLFLCPDLLDHLTISIVFGIQYFELNP